MNVYVLLLAVALQLLTARIAIGSAIRAHLANNSTRSAKAALEGYKRTLGHVDSAFSCKENAVGKMYAGGKK